MEKAREEQRYTEYFVLESYAGDWMISRRTSRLTGKSTGRRGAGVSPRAGCPSHPGWITYER